jgi:hypothetical protein
MMHPASAPRAIPQLGAGPSPASVGFRRNRKYLHKRCSVPAIRGDHIYTKAAQAATRSGRDKMNPTPSVGGGAGQWPEHYREDVAPACAFLNTFLSAFLGTFSVTQPLFATVFPGATAMAVNKPVGDNARKGAVRKRPQLETKIMGEKHWSKRNKESGQFMDQKEKGKFKGVRRER